MSIGTDDAPLLGIALKLASVAVLLAMASFVKVAAGAGVPPGEIVFFRSLLAVPVVVGWLAWRGDLATGLRMNSPALHLARGVIGAAAMGLIFTALGILPLAEVTAIGFAAPVLVTVLAAMFLGERIRVWRVSAVALGLAGVGVMLRPRLAAVEGGVLSGAPVETLGALAMLGAAIFMAGASTLVRRMVASEESAAIAFWFSVSCTVLSLATLPFGWVVPAAETLGVLALAGLFGGVGQILLTEAFRHGDAGLIAPFEYASMLFSLLVGWFVFAEAPPVATLWGAAMVIAAGLVIIWRERRMRRPRPVAAADAAARRA